MKRVGENLERLKLQAQLLVADAAEPGRWWDGKHFQRILLDAPCSATGVIRRHPDVKLLRRETDIPAMALRQMDLLQRLWPLLARGGRLVYASCSVLRMENAAVIQAFLEQHPDASEHTRTRLSELAFPVVNDRRGPGYALAAGEAGGDGFYYACLQKSDG
jgi:16S rRNA (cytosine967-C5)-methyltransferase